MLPPLQRVLTLLGLDVFAWYKLGMRRTCRAPLDREVSEYVGKGTMLQYTHSASCVLCDNQCKDTHAMCATCAADPLRAGCALQLRRRAAQQQLDAAERHCMRCARVHERGVAAECRSLDCAHMYARLKLTRQLHAAEKHAAALDRLDF